MTVSFGDDGATDRVPLAQIGDAGAGLYLCRAVTEPKEGEAPAKPAFIKKNVAFAGTIWGTLPTPGVKSRDRPVSAVQKQTLGAGLLENGRRAVAASVATGPVEWR